MSWSIESSKGSDHYYDGGYSTLTAARKALAQARAWAKREAYSEPSWRGEKFRIVEEKGHQQMSKARCDCDRYGQSPLEHRHDCPVRQAAERARTVRRTRAMSRSRQNPTKAQKRETVKKASAQRRVAVALAKFLKQANPAMKTSGASIQRLKGGVLKITPIKANAGGNKTAAFPTKIAAQRFAFKLRFHGETGVRISRGPAGAKIDKWLVTWN